jgi:predicted RNase H-like HicB family nuclease
MSEAEATLCFLANDAGAWRTTLIGMAAALKLTAIYEPVENGWIQGRIAELPAVITAAPSIEEAKEMLRDALTEYLASLQSSPQSSSPEANREELELTIAS